MKWKPAWVERLFGRRAGFDELDPDRESLGNSVLHSPVPGVTMLVLLWILSAVLLTLAVRQQQEWSSWVVGQKAPLAAYSRVDFRYCDNEATAKAKKAAFDEAAEYFRLDARSSESIASAVNAYVAGCGERAAGRTAIGEPAVLRLIETTPSGVIDAISRERLKGQNYLNFQTRFRRLLNRGILRRADKETRSAGRQLKTVDADGRSNLENRTVSDYPDPEQAAELLALALFPDQHELSGKFSKALRELMGPDGNLVYDAERSRESGERAASGVPAVIQSVRAGELMIGKGEVLTPALHEKLLAAEREIPATNIIHVLYYNLLCGLILVTATVFFVVKLQPHLVRDTRRVVIASVVIAAALFFNYWSINIFDYLLREGHVDTNELVIFAVPAALPMVLLAVMIGFRPSLCIGFLIASVTSLMVAPDRGLEIMLRWLAIGSLTALLLRRVANYRAYFLRALTGSFLFALVVNFDILYRTGKLFAEMPAALAIAGVNSLASATLALIMIFFFEIFFNLDTDMALSGLCNYSHPLLERLKREAPGTMFHSMTAATLAEDAARAINANPLRARVAGLFHDIGKLSMPQYFIENNRDSSNLHQKLNPRMSSKIIRDHVIQGLRLAREKRLFRWIRLAIATHHGDDLVFYFYQQARRQAREAGHGEESVSEADFRYSGTPPREKELAILSLADACEAASRSLTDPSPENLRAMVDSIIYKRLENGQLRNAELTLHELDVVRRSFADTLISINHGRIAYTTEPDYENRAAKLEKSKSPAAEA